MTIWAGFIWKYLVYVDTKWPFIHVPRRKRVK